MTQSREGIWLRLHLKGGSEVAGFARGAESPNDIWSTFKTQLVRLDPAELQPTMGKVRSFETLYVNRDQIVLAEVIPSPDPLD